MGNLKVYGLFFKQKRGGSSYNKSLFISQVKKLKFKESKYISLNHILSQAATELDIQHLITPPNIHFNILD